MTSSTTTLSLVDQLRADGKRRKLSDADIEAALVKSGYVQPPSAGLGQQALASAGGLGRMALQGVGDMASLPFGMAGAAYQGITGNEPPALLQGNQGTVAANQLGLPQPQGAAQRVLSAGGSDAVSSAPFGPVGMGLGFASGVARQTSAEMGAGPMGQMVASAVAGFGLPVVKTVLGGALRHILAGGPQVREAGEQARGLLRAATGGGEGMSAGQVAQGGLARTLQGGIRNIPGASEILKGAGERQAAAMGKQVDDIGATMGPRATKEAAGGAIQRGIEEGFMPSFRATANQLYNRVESLVPPTTGVMPASTTAIIAEYADQAAHAGPLAKHVNNPAVREILGDLEKAVAASPTGTIEFQVMKWMRTRLGKMMEGKTIVPDTDIGEIKRLRRAMGDDMGVSVQRTAGVKGTMAWNRANLFYDKGTDRIEQILNPLIRKNTAEQAFNAAMSGTRDGATALRSTMRSLSSTERGMVRATVLENMGKATPGTQNAAGSIFSPETYLTNWNSLSAEARVALFEGPEVAEARRGLDVLAKAAEIRKKTSGTLPNPSGTAQNTAFYSVMSGLGALGTGAVTGTIGGAGIGGALGGPVTMAGANLAARMFTNPRIIEWMVKQTRAPFGALAQQLALLTKEAEKWSAEDREIALDVASQLGTVAWDKVLLALAGADASSVGRNAP